MTLVELLTRIAEVQGSQTATLAPGPLHLRVSENDGTAARLLLWLSEHMMDNTVGNALDVLDCARWWLTFWTALEDKGQGSAFSDFIELLDMDKST